jgi:acyl-CoA thioesterase FadM
VRFGYDLRLHGEARALATASTVHSFVDSQGRVLRLDRYPELWARVQAAAVRLAPAGA